MSATPYYMRALPTALGFEHDFDAAVFVLFEGPVGFASALQPVTVGNDEGWINLTFLDTVEERLHVAVDVGLSHSSQRAA